MVTASPLSPKPAKKGKGNVDTYTISFTNGSTSTFTVTNGVNGTNGTNGQDGQDGQDGNGIASIAKTSTDDLVDTYTITYTNGNATTFTVTNGAEGPTGPTGPAGQTGKGISSVAKTSTVGLVDTYTITYTDETTSTFTITNGEAGQDGVSPVVSAAASGSNVIITVVDGDGSHEYVIPTTSGEVTQLPANWTEENSSSPQYIMNKPTLATVATSGNYNDLSNKPEIPDAQVNADWNATSGVAQILNKPEIPNAQVNADWNAVSGVAQILNKPTLATVATSGSYNDLTNKPEIPDAQVNADWNATSGVAQILNKPEIPNAQVNADWNAVSGVAQILNKPEIPEYQILSISNDTIFLTNGGFVKLTWDNISGKPSFANVAFTNEYSDLSNKPTNLSQFTNDQGYITLSEVPIQQQADWNEADPTAVSYIVNKPVIPATQVNADWDATSGVAQILNKPVIPDEQVNANWNEADPTSKAYIENKPDLSNYLTSSDLSNYVTKTENETVGGDKTFTGDVTLSGDNVVSANGSLEVPSVLDNVASDGTLNLSSSTGTGNCEQTVNFCDLQTVYDNMLAKFNALNDQIDNLLDSIKDLNKQLKTPKDGEPCPNTPTVTDIDGNTYSTVRIGNQCWMRENLRVTKYPNGTAIVESTNTATNTPYRRNPAGGANALSVQGYLYNYTAASAGLSAMASEKIQGICPTGWHLPTRADWNELKTYVGTKDEFKCSNNYTYIAKALSSPLYWASNGTEACRPGNDIENNNATGFSVVPAGYAYNSGEVQLNSAHLWASDGYYAYLSNATYYVSIYSTSTLYYSRSVRCLRDNTNGENNTVNAPAVETIDSIRDITQNSAWIMGGKITDDGGMPITRYGLVVGTSASVTIPTATTVASSTYSISIPYTMGGYNVTGLSTNTAYYYRAFAINAIDTVYGEAFSFHTVEDGLPCPGLATITDIDGNTYNTVMIGSQCWLKENLKVTKYADNTSIAKSNADSDTEPYYTDPEMNAANGAGYLYNWSAVMNGAASSSANPSGVRGICPVGWHVPSDEEFDVLATYVKSKPEYLCNSNNNNNAKALAATIGWDNTSTACTPGNDPSNNNATGFSAIENTSGYADFWTATQGNYYIGYNGTSFSHVNNSLKENFFGVRCLKDAATTASSPKLPTVEIESIDDPTDATHHKSITATVSNDGGAAVTSRHIYYSKTPHPSPSNYAGISAFTDSSPVNCILKINLEAGTTYYFRAAAQNSVGWAYSDEYSFTTDSAGGAGMMCPGTTSVTDKNGNGYATIQIGTQCWMAKNMRGSKYADGSTISSYIPNGAGTINTDYGRLYTYAAVMNGSSTSTGSVQGICPSGWHVPSSDEFQTLKSFLSSQSTYQCNSNANNISKAIASRNDWAESSNECSPGNEMSSNNASGFDAFPAGYYSNSTYHYYGERSGFATSNAGYIYFISYQYPLLYNYTLSDPADAYSVRCIKGATPPSVKTNNNVTNIGKNNATVGGVLMSDGTNSTFDASSVTEFGICYSKNNNNPSISDNKKTKTPIVAGSYNIDLTGLTMGSTYYYRAYATNANGTQYGEVKSFSTLKGATVSNYAVTSITKTSARVRGMITANQDTVISWGFFLYKKNSSGNFVQVMDAYHANTDQFTTSGYTVKLVSTPKTGVYSMDISGLEEGATYKYKAEIRTIFQGWVYASAQSAEFTTLAAPEVSTEGYTYTGNGTNSAKYTLKGSIVKKGNPNYTKRGFVWCKSNAPSSYVAEPTLRENQNSSFHIENASDSGAYSLNTFTANTPGVTYRFRAFAINNSDTVYGEVKTFTSPTKPTMSFSGDSEAPYNYSNHVTKNSIKMTPACTNHGGSNLFIRGLVYTTNESLSSETPTNGTVSENASEASTKWVKVAGTSGSTQEITISGLSSNTTYYIRSYGSNSAGTGYSTVVKKVKTALECGQTLTDQNGNTYSTIKIGTQCWMRSNLKATNYDNVAEFSTAGTGEAIELRTGNPSPISSTIKYRYNPNNSSSNVNSYGYLYNWPAATGEGLSNMISTYPNMTTAQGKTQGVCPRGWHVPTTAELTTLRNSLNNDNSQYYYFNSLAGRMLHNGYYSEFGNYLNLWSNTEYNTELKWGTVIFYSNRTSYTFTYEKQVAVSVRCLQD